MARRDNFFTQAGRTDQKDPRRVSGAIPGRNERYAPMDKLQRANMAALVYQTQRRAAQAIHTLISEVGHRDNVELRTDSFLHHAREDNIGRRRGRIPVIGALQPEIKGVATFATRVSRLISLGECFDDDGRGRTEGYVQFLEEEGVSYPGHRRKFPEDGGISHESTGDFRMLGAKIYRGLPGATLAAEGRPDEDLDAIYAAADLIMLPDSSCEQPTLNHSEMERIAALIASPGMPSMDDVRYVGNIHFPDDNPGAMSISLGMLADIADVARRATPSDPSVPPTGTPTYTPPIFP